MKKKKWWKVISVLACILWMGFIFYNSSQDGTLSYSFSGKFLEKVIEIKDKLIGTSEESESSAELIVNKQLLVNVSNNETLSNTAVLGIIPNYRGLTKGEQNDIIRKYAHAFEYFILAILYANALFAFGHKGKKAIVYILFGVLFYACTDEYHQLFVQGRNSNIKDVFIDFAGGIIGTIFYYFVYYTNKKALKLFK